MTLTKLAKLAETSVGTVSKAFSGSSEISEKTRNRIYEIAKKYNCFDKYFKAPRGRPLIALMPPEPESEYYGREIGLIEKALTKMGADTIITFTRFDSKRYEQLFRELAYGLKADGLILWGSCSYIKNPDHHPLIAITPYPPQNSDKVRLDWEGGMADLTEALKRYGHTDVGFIGEKLTVAKEELLKSAMRHTGIAVHDKFFFRSRHRFFKAGEEGMSELIKSGTLPSVIVAAYDQIACGAMHAAKNAGYKIPEEISFVGMDNISATPYLDLPLSSLQPNFESAAYRIAELIFKRIENKYYRSKEEITVPITLNIRDSLYNRNK